MAFEVFTETRARSAEFISVNETQGFGFPRTFLDRYGITKDHKAVILFDAEANKLALHFTKKDVKFGFSVQVGNDKHGAIVKAKSFFERRGVDAAKYAGRYYDFQEVNVSELGQEGNGKAYVITLKDKSADAPKGGSGRKSTEVFPAI